MLALVLASLTLIALGARAGFVHRRLQGQQRLWRSACGPFSVELRRRALLSRAHADSQAFPQPRERRSLTLRLAGVPLWSIHTVVALPPERDARIDSVDASEFDHLFGARFRRLGPAWSLRMTFVA